ncbi:SRPBCC domain-containing protein [Radiobacillus deserti]|uniref:ATPase n=1 Tax=Radiobacillus deserti TaxID=2594883 RepID=A0A516KJJ5_9BACI|nr:SRPBCC domain-containing protein [Radiobacillus deserti]QDP41573.1 ATPase [Radiobacillus deserti]
MSKTKIVAEKGAQNVVISREFNSPRELVFNTYTDPTTVPEWWGPKRYKTTVDRMDVKKGGIWRFIHRDVEGNEYAFNGVYHEVNSPERIINTFEVEGYPEFIGLVTINLEKMPGGKTKFIENTVYQSVEGRDGMIKAGMSEGAIELLDRLEELLDSIQNV